MLKLLAVVSLLGYLAASPVDPIVKKLDPVRYHHAMDENGEYHTVDMWMTSDDIAETANYIPSAQNIYHLFTRESPTVSNPLVYGNEEALRASHFNNNRRIVILLHGWRNNAVSNFNRVLVPAFLEAEDLNVIAVDWSAGSGTINYPVALDNTIESGKGVAAFIDWLNSVAGTNPVQYHIVGHGLGGHQAGIVGRHVTGSIPYVTGLDPSILGWINHPDRFQPEDAAYTEVIHTNAGVNGFISDLALVDFYPNGGESMPGCDTHSCDHDMSFHYFAESVRSGGFSGRRCSSVITALIGSCVLPGTLAMGGLQPKLGFVGIYHLHTNAAPPFSRG